MRSTQFLCIAFAILCSTGCYKDEAFTPLKLEPNEVICELRTEPAVLSANGSATSVITALLPDGGQENLDVVLTTTSGVFTQNNAKTITAKSKAVRLPEGVRICATATLRNSNEIGTITITANLGGYEVEREITSIDNPATGIAIVVPSLVLSNDASSEMEIVAQLDAESGTVSQEKQVGLEVFDQTSTPRGTFRTVQDRSDAEGKCRFAFSIAPDSLFTGALTIRATTPGPNGILEALRTIYITN